MSVGIAEGFIKPCPFCGSPAKALSWHVDGPYMDSKIVCTKCRAASGTTRVSNKLGCFDGQNNLHVFKAIKKWNRRT
jgi:hypothetical protein